MVFTDKNRNLAEKYVGKKMIFWSDSNMHYSNVYIGVLRSVLVSNYYFEIKKSTQELREERTDKCTYLNNISSACFEFCKPFVDKDKKGNFLLDF